jgi:hypothetical protein
LFEAGKIQKQHQSSENTHFEDQKESRKQHYDVVLEG